MVFTAQAKDIGIRIDTGFVFYVTVCAVAGVFTLYCAYKANTY